jgi:hypothetical protein
MASEATYTKMAEAMQRVTRELQLESDRGCVVLAFAWMDECSTQNLLRFLLPSAHQSAKADELLGVGRPIGDAATKIDLSFRLGLLQHPQKSSPFPEAEERLRPPRFVDHVRDTDRSRSRAGHI